MVMVPVEKHQNRIALYVNVKLVKTSAGSVLERFAVHGDGRVL